MRNCRCECGRLVVPGPTDADAAGRSRSASRSHSAGRSYSAGRSQSAGVAAGVAHPARMYDYYLGGKDNFEADRVAAEKAMAAVPDARNLARTNREFLVRAVRSMAAGGIDQFIDLGSGFPTSPNVHEVVPGARVVYVDNDPVVVSHNQALRTSPLVVSIFGDLRAPQDILADAVLARAIDFSRPVGVLLVAVLHFV